jgi:hypothetical protein
MKIYLQLGFLVSSLLMTTLLAANDCEYGMDVACPPNLDPQSFVNGLEVQLNGGVGSEDQACPPVSHIYWDWGDGIFEEAYFPAYHQYSSTGTYTISVHATDENSEVVADASCTLSLANSYACAGFYSPMNDYPVMTKKNRVFPLKMELFDDAGFELMDHDLTAPPVFQVLLDPSSGEPEMDVSGDAFPAGKGSDGNQFVYTDEGIWQFNLKSSNYSASGDYMVTVVSGDESNYTISPACVTVFHVK